MVCDFEPAPPPVSPAQRRPVLMLSTNGIGLGHLSRQLAIGSRLPAPLVPVLYSQSSGIRLAREAGFLTLHAQHHRYSGIGVEAWNRRMGQDLLSLARHLNPVAVVADCTVVFGGYVRLLEACAGRIPRIWVRRGFLAPEHARAVEAARHFDHIIEPGDLAAELDLGPSAPLRDQVHQVPPILYVTPNDRLPRALARRQLGLETGQKTIALLLGHTLGQQTARIRAAICAALAGSGHRLLDIRSSLAAEPLAEVAQSGVDSHQLYPAFALSRAFDGMITLAGYNAFHEAMLGKIPTLFLTWPQPGMDRQDLRVAWAVQRGLALGRDAEPLARGEAGDLAQQIEELLSGRISTALNRPDAPSAQDGASAAAALIAGWIASA